MSGNLPSGWTVESLFVADNLDMLPKALNHKHHNIEVLK